MRYLSLLLGVLCIAWVYRFAADTLERRSALVAAFLTSTSGFVILYFHEIRFYTLILWLALAHAWLYWRLATGARAGWRTWFFFSASASALLYTHSVSAAFFFAGLCGQHLLFAFRLRRWRQIVFAWAFALLTFLPFAPHYLAVATTESTIFVVQARAPSTPELLAQVAQPLVNDLLWLWLPLIVLGGGTLWRNRKATIFQLFVMLAGMFLSVLLFHQLLRLIDSTRLRYFLFLMPFFAVVCARLVLDWRRYRLLSLLFLLLWAAGGYGIYRQAEDWAYAGRNWLLQEHPPLHRFTDALQGKTQAQDMFFSFNKSGMINKPLRRQAGATADYYLGLMLGIDGAFVSAKLTSHELREQYRQQVDDSPYLLFAYEKNDKAANFDEVLVLLQADYRACAPPVVDTDELFVQRYVYHSLTCDRAYAPIQYDNGITIVDKFADYDKEQKTVRVVTGWQVADKALLEQYSVSLQILNSAWEKKAQAPDRYLFDDILKWYVAELSTAALPPGDYRVVVIVYDSVSGQKVSGADLTSGEVGTILPIHSFSIKE